MLAGCYLVHGGEPLQTEEIIAAIKDQAGKEGYTNIEVFELNTLIWEELLNKCQTLDLFAERTLIELRLSGETLNKQANSNLEQILLQQDSNLHIIIRANKLKTTTLNSNWAKHIQKHGKVFVAKDIPSQQWPMWLQKRLTQAGFTLNKDALELMARCYEGNLLAATQCIKKLSAAFPSGQLNLDQIKPFIDDNNSFSLFELTNAALSGEVERTLRILESLQNEGIDPILILWGLTKEIRTLLNIKNDVQNGIAFAQSAQNRGVWRDNMPKMRKAADRLSSAKLQRLLQIGKSVDAMIKGLQMGNPWEHLLTMYVVVAGKEFLTMEDLCL
jgi:DNA polymerase-3 subunit delta